MCFEQSIVSSKNDTLRCRKSYLQRTIKVATFKTSSLSFVSASDSAAQEADLRRCTSVAGARNRLASVVSVPCPAYSALVSSSWFASALKPARRATGCTQSV